MKLTLTTVPSVLEKVASVTARTDEGKVYSLVIFNRAPEAKAFIASAAKGDVVEAIGTIDTDRNGSIRLVADTVTAWLSPEELEANHKRILSEKANIQFIDADYAQYGPNTYRFAIKGNGHIWITNAADDGARWEAVTGVRMAGVAHIPVGEKGKLIPNYVQSGDMYLGKLKRNEAGEVIGYNFNCTEDEFGETYIFRCTTSHADMRAVAAAKVGAK